MKDIIKVGDKRLCDAAMVCSTAKKPIYAIDAGGNAKSVFTPPRVAQVLGETDFGIGFGCEDRLGMLDASTFALKFDQAMPDSTCITFSHKTVAVGVAHQENMQTCASSRKIQLFEIGQLKQI